jgi:hypothetical protein
MRLRRVLVGLAVALALGLAERRRRSQGEQPVEANGDDRLAALQAAYDDLRRETDRLRDARGAFTRQLGPLPISAAVVAGLVTGFAPPDWETAIRSEWMLWVAGGLFGVLVLSSILYGNLRPYRVLRKKTEEEWEDGASPSELVDRLVGRSEAAVPANVELELYKAMVLLEQRIYGEPRRRWWQWRLPWRIKTLQEGFERERSGLVLVQALFALVVLFLVLARLVH